MATAGLALVLLAVVGMRQGVANPRQQDNQQTNASPASTTLELSPLKGFMRLKLQASNHILEGLVTDDMKKVTTGALMLQEMSVAEKWRVSNDMLYRQHSREFRDSVNVLQEKADKNSLDGVTLAWMDVTHNCIQCHQWVRNELIAETSLDGHDIPAAEGVQ